MGSLSHLGSTRVSALAIMATRSQDQQLVASVAAEHPMGPPRLDGAAAHDAGPSGHAHDSGSTCCVVPSFGWHPWYSHHLYDDGHTTAASWPSLGGTGATPELIKQAKTAHYRAILCPSPPDDFIDALPTPLPLSCFISATRSRLHDNPKALIGEVGLDKAFRLPEHEGADDAAGHSGLTPGTRHGRRLSPYRVVMAHQQAILTAQLRLAGQEGRPVSVHGVQAHGVLFDTLSACWKGHERRRRAAEAEQDESDDDDDDDDDDDKKEHHDKPEPKPFPPRICLHSFSGSVEILRQWLHPSVPAKVFVSFSSAVNLGSQGARARLDDVVQAVPHDRILVESDVHQAGPAMEAALEDMYRRVCRAKQWPLAEGVSLMRCNFDDFVFGSRREDE
ncbi:hypothetical protein CDD82_620 [Ophiocordyceps australis]|uniref:Cut9 interacting protein Scn1 n=1 Tax=Ophiocordyceps australis TaxID=1399860 RepID=A0A2C5XDF1_9HYPO|nr:hypothetical protein CDD82_620 [Ophiocordyceps australis]